MNSPHHSEQPPALRLSVVIPAYNAKDCIAAAIKTVADQTIQPYEILVIDDGSHDNTARLVECIAAEQPGLTLLCLSLSKNRGPSAARNIGWDTATGDYVAFLDADDLWHPKKLEHTICLLTAHPELDLLGHAFAVSKGDAATFSELPAPNDLPALRPIQWLPLMLCNILQASCVVIRHSLPHRFDDTMQYNEDHELFCRITQDRQVAFLPLNLTLRSRSILDPGGQSSDTARMRRGELRTYTKLTLRRPLWLPLLPLLWTFSMAKHLRKTRILRYQTAKQGIGKAGPCQPSVLLLYHFYPPDDVVSGQLFADLATDLVRRGWDTDVLTSNRLCHQPDSTVKPTRECRDGVSIHRTWRPPLDQSRHLSRLANAIWLFAAWSWRILRLHPYDAYIIGSDPQFSQLLFPVLRLLRPRSRIIFWCHDLFPDAIEALIFINKGNITRRGSCLSILYRITRKLLQSCYCCVNVIVDLGPCMAARLAAYDHHATTATVTPWALLKSEMPLPLDPDTRHKIFGETPLALLYSGNLGYAHDFVPFLHLAEKLANITPKAMIVFGCRGNRVHDLEATLHAASLPNVRRLDFISEVALASRLAAADFHLLSLKSGWEGIVVPSKFFGSLATGRPIIYAGPMNSAPALWIQEYNLGFILTPYNTVTIAAHLAKIIQNQAFLTAWNHHIQTIYRHHFSRKIMLDRFAALLHK
ncbi:colanic acid biosynthesis glycosyl transferase WcaI [Desulfovibrionales bacterium]